MKRLVVAALVLLAVQTPAANAASSAPAIQISEIAAPAAAGAVGAALDTALDGTVWLGWIEPAAADARTIQVSTLAPGASRWDRPHAVATGSIAAGNAADAPTLAASEAGHATAAWADGHGGVLLSATTDGGESWGIPAPLSRESDAMTQASLATLADDRVLALWLDGRVKKTGGRAPQLFARIVGEPGPDELVDAAVCGDCPTTLTAFPDGSALAAWRGQTEEQVRDIRTARFRGKAWDEPRPLNNDDWRLAASPANGPRLASDRGRVAAAWFTGADNDPRVLASFSPDAGERFLMPLRVDCGHPTGQVNTLILHDGALLVTWLEADGSLWLRRITPDFSVTAPIQIASGAAGRVTGFPCAALVDDYAGGKTAARALIAFVREGQAAPLHTVIVTVPEGALLEAERNCECAPTAAELQGIPMRGTVVAVEANRGVLRVQHDELPGMLAAGTREFRAAPDVISAAQPGRQFLGRVERSGGAWWLFDVRLLVAPPNK